MSIRSWPFIFLIIARLFCVRANAGEFDFRDLERLVEGQQVSSLEEILEKLPREMRSRFNLIANSRSTRQFADRTNPRVTLANSDGTLVLAFNGKKGSTGYGQLEVVRFDQESKQFEFKLIDFVGGKGSINHKPETCFACHRGRPIWNTYPFWAGMFGESHHSVGAGELADVTRFVEAANSDPLYRHLVFEDDVLKQLHDNNATMGDRLASLNYERIFLELKAHPHWHQVSDLMGTILLDRKLYYGSGALTSVDSYLERISALGVHVDRAHFDTKLATIYAQLEKYDKFVFTSVLYPETSRNTVGTSQAVVTALLELITDSYGLPGPREWTITFKRDSYALVNSMYGLLDLGRYFPRPYCRSLLD